MLIDKFRINYVKLNSNKKNVIFYKKQHNYLNKHKIQQNNIIKSLIKKIK